MSTLLILYDTFDLNLLLYPQIEDKFTVTPGEVAK